MASSVTEALAEARCSIIYSRLLAQAAWSEVSAVRLCRRSMVVLLVSKLAGYLKAFDGRRLVNLQDAPGRLLGLFRYGIGQRASEWVTTPIREWRAVLASSLANGGKREECRLDSSSFKATSIGRR